MSETGKNLTPPDLGVQAKQTVFQMCDEAMKAILVLYKVQHIVGIGRFAEDRAKRVVQSSKLPIRVHFMVHPSPASAIANKGWNALAERSLTDANIMEYFCTQ